MAKIQNEVETTMAEEAVMEKEAVYDPWEKVEITTPRSGKKEVKSFMVGINGVVYTIPYGKKSVVPRCVAEEYWRSEQAKDDYDRCCEEEKERLKAMQEPA